MKGDAVKEDIVLRSANLEKHCLQLCQPPAAGLVFPVRASRFAIKHPALPAPTMIISYSRRELMFNDVAAVGRSNVDLVSLTQPKWVFLLF